MSRPIGEEMMSLVARLAPLCRSITGDGVRQTLDHLETWIPLERHEVPSGTAVLDWTVPREWNIRDAWIKDGEGRRVVDFHRSNLHVVSYSVPVPEQRISREDLEPHLHSMPDRPDWIPYRTSYYEETWGFCLSENDRRALDEPEYEVCIDATLEPGALSYAECLIPGQSTDEVLVSAHVCHPSLCNDNLSGVAVATALARTLAQENRRLSYRFVFAPGTIGALAWLERNRDRVGRIVAGTTLVCLGNDEGLTFKRTFEGNTVIDRAAALVVGAQGERAEGIDFHPYGYDERQYNSPGFRLPVGSLMRGRHGEFPEYHTSADDLDFISADRLEGAYDWLMGLFDVLDANVRFRGLAPYGEPQLGRRGLYGAIGQDSDRESLTMAILWVLQFADGRHDLMDVAASSGLPWRTLVRAFELLVEGELVDGLTSDPISDPNSDRSEGT